MIYFHAFSSMSRSQLCCRPNVHNLCTMKLCFHFYPFHSSTKPTLRPYCRLLPNDNDRGVGGGRHWRGCSAGVGGVVASCWGWRCMEHTPTWTHTQQIHHHGSQMWNTIPGLCVCVKRIKWSPWCQIDIFYFIIISKLQLWMYRVCVYSEKQ